MKKESEYRTAIKMRRKGRTYNEILSVVPVAKSTLSLWLRSVDLAKPQKQRITQKRIDAQRKGALTRFNTRIQEVADLATQGKKDIDRITPRELWLIATALYWAEGSKQNTASISAGIQFANSDVRMLNVFLKWLRVLQIPEDDIYYELYVHDNRKNEVEAFRSWWAAQMGINRSKLNRIYFKRDKPKTNRTKVGDLYHGLVRIRVRSSTILNRKISGWIEGIVAACRFV